MHFAGQMRQEGPRRDLEAEQVVFATNALGIDLRKCASCVGGEHFFKKNDCDPMSGLRVAEKRKCWNFIGFKGIFEGVKWTTGASSKSSQGTSRHGSGWKCFESISRIVPPTSAGTTFSRNLLEITGKCSGIAFESEKNIENPMTIDEHKRDLRPKAFKTSRKEANCRNSTHIYGIF